MSAACSSSVLGILFGFRFSSFEKMGFSYGRLTCAASVSVGVTTAASTGAAIGSDVFGRSASVAVGATAPVAAAVEVADSSAENSVVEG